MIEPRLVSMLACPETGQAVHVADAMTVALLNAAIAAGTCRNAAGSAVREPIESALVREDGAVCYPIRDGIPLMIVDEALRLTPPA